MNKEITRYYKFFIQSDITSCLLPTRVNLGFIYYGKLKMTSFELFSRKSETFNANANKMVS